MTAKPSRPASWCDAVDRFLTHLAEAEKSPNTIDAYRGDLKQFHAWYQADCQDEPELSTISAQDLRQWKASMLQCHRAPQTVNRRLAAIQSLLRWAQSHEWAQAVQSPRAVRQEPPRPRWLARKERNALIRAVDKGKDARAIALVKVLLHVGLRVSELASLTWSAVEISDKSGSLKVIGKGRKQRSVRLNVEARDALKAWAKKNNAGPDHHVFTGREGPLTRKSLWKIIARYGRDAGLHDLTPHVLRHTFCHDLAAAGTRIEEIASLAGHESIETTRRYLEPGQDDLQAAVDRLAGEGETDEPQTTIPAPRTRRKTGGRT